MLPGRTPGERERERERVRGRVRGRERERERVKESQRETALAFPPDTKELFVPASTGTPAPALLAPCDTMGARATAR